MAALVMALTMFAGGAALCDEDDEEAAEQFRHDENRAERALTGRRSGELKPITELMARVLDKFEGRIVESEFEEYEGRLLYEFYVLGRDGTIREVYVDPVTGDIVATREDD